MSIVYNNIIFESLEELKKIYPNARDRDIVTTKLHKDFLNKRDDETWYNVSFNFRYDDEGCQVNTWIDCTVVNYEFIRNYKGQGLNRLTTPSNMGLTPVSYWAIVNAKDTSIAVSRFQSIISENNGFIFDALWTYIRKETEV